MKTLLKSLQATALAVGLVLGVAAPASATQYSLNLADTVTPDGRQGGAYLYYNTVGGDLININYLFQDMKLTYDSADQSVRIYGSAYGYYDANNSQIATADQDLISAMEGYVTIDMLYQDNVSAEFDAVGNLSHVNVASASDWNAGYLAYDANNLVTYLFDEAMSNSGLSLDVTANGLGEGWFYGNAALVDNDGYPTDVFASHVSGDWYFCTRCGGHDAPVPEPMTMTLLGTAWLLAQLAAAVKRLSSPN